MSRTPKNKNHVQAFLYHSGEKALGHDVAAVEPDYRVRQRGAKRVGGVALTVLAGATAVATFAFANRHPEPPVQDKVVSEITHDMQHTADEQKSGNLSGYIATHPGASEADISTFRLSQEQGTTPLDANVPPPQPPTTNSNSQ